MLPIKMVVPYPNARCILLKMSANPIAGCEKFLPALFVPRAAKRVVVAQSPLGDRNRVVLQPDLAAVIEHRNTLGVAVSGIVRLSGKGHVVFAKFTAGCIGINFRHLIPERELAVR